MKVAAVPRWVGPLALAAAVTAAVVGLWSGLSWAPDFCDRLRDDAFYEFSWAANLAAGRGPMVSDGTTTSGVQLLWSLLLVPVAFCFGAPSLPLVAPWLGLGLHTAAAAAIARGGRDRLVSRCAALCWLGNPLLVREAQNGQETALACLVLVLLWQQRGASERRYFVLALAAVFARTDLFGFVAALSLLRLQRYQWRAVLTPIVVVTLHLVTCAALGGGMLADSAAPMAWLWHQNHAATDPGLGDMLATHWWYLRPVLLGGPWALASTIGIGLAVFALVRPWLPKAWRLLPLLLVGGAELIGLRDHGVAASAALFLLLWPAKGRRGLPRGLLALFVGSAAILVLHWAVRWYPRDYYAAPLVVLATVAVLRLGRWRWALLVFAVAQLVQGPILPEPLVGQRSMAMGGRHLAEVLPPGERVGCFNSGLATFEADVLRSGESGRRGVVNLDGVVDARAFAALRRGRLAAWLDQEGVRFVLDNPVQFASDPRLPHANGHWFAPDFAAEEDLVEVARFVAPGAGGAQRPGTGSFRLYWRRGRGEPPAPLAAARDLGRLVGGRCVLWPARAGQRLDIESEGGGMVPLVGADTDTAVIVFVPDARRGTGRLFVHGRTEPVLTLPRL